MYGKARNLFIWWEWRGEAAYFSNKNFFTTLFILDILQLTIIEVFKFDGSNRLKWKSFILQMAVE